MLNYRDMFCCCQIGAESKPKLVSSPKPSTVHVSCFSRRCTCRARQEASAGANVAWSVRGFISTPSAIKLCKSLPVCLREWNSVHCEALRPCSMSLTETGGVCVCVLLSLGLLKDVVVFKLPWLGACLHLNIGMDRLQLEAWLINWLLFFGSVALILIKV